MDFPNTLHQPRSYFPPHSTQLHPRMITLSSSSSSPPSKSHSKYLFLLISLFTFSFLFCLFSTALQIHSSPKFSSPKPAFFALLIHAAPSTSRLSLLHFLSEGRLPFLGGEAASASAEVKLVFMGFQSDPDGVRGSVVELVEFAKMKVPKKEWGNTMVRLVASQELEGLGNEVRDKVLECFRQVLRLSRFFFKDEWARVIPEEEQGISSWVAVNYALGNLGCEPQETTGILELGGASLQVTSALHNAKSSQSSRTIRLSGVTYNLYTRSWPQLGQDAAWKTLEELLKYRELKSSSRSSGRTLVNPCIPRGYPWISNASHGKCPIIQPAGNFSACKSEALSMLKKIKDRCHHPPCKITSSFYELSGEQVSSRSYLYTSEVCSQ